MAIRDQDSIRSHFFFKWFIGAVLLLIIVLLLLGGKSPTASTPPAASMPVETPAPAATQERVATPEPAPSFALPTLDTPELGDDGVLHLAGTGEPGATVAIFANGEKLGDVKVGPDGTWALDLDSLSPGEYNFQVQTLDEDGQQVNASPPLSFTLPEPVSQSAPPPQLTCKPYVVQPGDWLTKLAVEYLGDMDAYTRIVEATNAAAAQDPSFITITDPDLIEPGQKLCIPQS